MQRRRLRDKKLREHRVHPRYNNDEFELVQRAAALSRMAAGGYVAECSLAAARADDPTAAVADYRATVKALMAANGLLGKVGSNLNQLTWHLHQDGAWPHLTKGDEQTAQGQLVALGATLDLLPVMAPTAARADLEQAAAAFERATRSRITADLDSTRALRRSVQTIWRERPQDSDGTGLTMLLDAALTAVAFALHWHRTRQHAQQEAAAEQALLYLQAAYARTAEPVLVSLASRTPGPQTKRRFAHHLQDVVPDHAERILNDPAWDALATVLAEAEAAGHNAATVLSQALHQRTLDDARSPARALTWRIRRLGEHHVPGPWAQAARAHSAMQRPSAPVHPTAAIARPPQGSPTQRR